jgi:DNA-binding NarL/FixJ family response regulator
MNPSGQGLTVAIVEDHAVLREILVTYVECLPSVSTCSAVSSAEQALSELDALGPDVMFVDLSLPGMTGIELIAELRRSHPEIKCAILSGHRSGRYVAQAFDAGAKAYLLKGDPLEIDRGLDAILAGRSYVSTDIDGVH